MKSYKCKGFTSTTTTTKIRTIYVHRERERERERERVEAKITWAETEILSGCTSGLETY